MIDHTPFFHLISRDVSALLAVAEYIEITGQDRMANLVRSMTLSIEQTVCDLRHDLLRSNRRVKPDSPRKRKRTISTRHDQSTPASSVKSVREAQTVHRLRPKR